MNRSSVIGIAIVAIIVTGIGVFALNGDNTNNPSDMGSMNKDAGKSDQSSESSMVAPNTVIMDNFNFQQAEITVKKGTTVTWKNQDTAKHNVVFDDENVGKVEGSKLITQGEELQFTFDKAGEFSYFCEPHPYMKARVIVSE